MASIKQIKVTLNRSTAGTLPVHRQCVKGLGLKRIRHSVIVLDNACTRGMINKVSHLVSVEEV